MIKFLFFITTIISTIGAILGYTCGFIAPSNHYIIGLIALSTPLWMALNTILIPYWLFKKWKNLFFPILSLLVCFPLILRTYKFKTSLPNEKNSFTILNQNVCVFTLYDEMTRKNYHEVKHMTDYLLESGADVLCLHEFYNDSKSQNDYNTTEILSTKYPYHYIEVSYSNRLNRQFGQAIFSKHPLSNKTKLNKESGGNFTMYADVSLRGRSMRIYNTHLASMSLPQNIDQEIQKDEKVRNKILSKFKNGFNLRTEQVNEIYNSIKDCQLPVILTGDFNDTPYSFAYNHISDIAVNSFEVAGSGFGFSYNSEKNNPWLIPLRIDNHFYTPQSIKCLSLETDHKIKTSDHFPLIGTYTFK